MTVLMAFLYVCMYGGHSILHSNSKLHDNFGKMQTSDCSAHARPIRMARIILVIIAFGIFSKQADHFSLCIRAGGQLIKCQTCITLC